MAGSTTFSQDLDAELVRRFAPEPRRVADVIGGFRRLTGAAPSKSAPWPFPYIGGNLTHALVATGLGTGAGWLYGRYIHPLINPDADPETSGRAGAIVGGGAMALGHVPGLWSAAQRYQQRRIAEADRTGVVPPGGMLNWIRGVNKVASRAYRTPGSGVTGPAVPGPRPFDHGFSAGHAREDVAYDPYLTPQQRSTLISNMPPGRGMITGGDVARGLVGAAVGYAGAGLLGTALGTMFGMSRPTQRKLRAAGAFAGALRNVGAI